ncbi:hypothetical protein ACTFIV_006911, partial [Dictyostelium citrinum]
MGGLVNLMPLTYQCMLIGTLALTGFPFLSGYYSKDIILETSYATYYWEGTFAAIIGYVAAFGTTFYSFRLLILTFFNKPRMQYKTIAGVHEASTNMVIPLVILAICSIFIGYLTKDLFVGLGTPIWNNSFFAYPYNNLILESEVLQRELKLLPLFAFIYGVLTPVLFYFNLKEDRMITLIQNPIAKENLDKGLWEQIGVTGVANALVNEFTEFKLNNEITLSTYISYIVQAILLIIFVGIFSFMVGFLYVELFVILGILYLCLPKLKFIRYFIIYIGKPYKRDIVKVRKDQRNTYKKCSGNFKSGENSKMRIRKNITKFIKRAYIDMGELKQVKGYTKTRLNIISNKVFLLKQELYPLKKQKKQLEKRIDMILLRSGFVRSIYEARQLINHKHILVNGNIARIPSYTLNVGDIISIKEGSHKQNLI